MLACVGGFLIFDPNIYKIVLSSRNAEMLKNVTVTEWVQK